MEVQLGLINQLKLVSLFHYFSIKILNFCLKVRKYQIDRIRLVAHFIEYIVIMCRFIYRTQLTGTFRILIAIFVSLHVLTSTVV